MQIMKLSRTTIGYLISSLTPGARKNEGLGLATQMMHPRDALFVELTR